MLTCAARRAAAAAARPPIVESETSICWAALFNMDLHTPSDCALHNQGMYAALAAARQHPQEQAHSSIRPSHGLPRPQLEQSRPPLSGRTLAVHANAECAANAAICFVDGRD